MKLGPCRSLRMMLLLCHDRLVFVFSWKTEVVWSPFNCCFSSFNYSFTNEALLLDDGSTFSRVFCSPRSDCAPAKCSRAAMDDETAQRLWELSCKILGITWEWKLNSLPDDFKFYCSLSEIGPSVKIRNTTTLY